MIIHSFLNVAAIIAACMIILFLLALALKNNSIVDIFWGLGFVIVAFASLFFAPPVTFKKILLDAAILCWGVRLSAHIYIRNKGRGEDFRYKAWRDIWKHFAIRSFFQVFVFEC